MFDHFDADVSPEDSQECSRHEDWNDYMQTVDGLNDEAKKELDEIDMRIEQAEAEFVGAAMERLDKGTVKFI